LHVRPGAYLAFVIEPHVADAVKLMARAAKATDSMVLLAAFDALLHRYTGAEDVAVGVPVANRRREAEELIGFFVNQLSLRVDLSGRPSFVELVRRVREIALAAYSHQDLPFDEIVAAAGRAGTTPLMPLVNVQFDSHTAPFGTLKIDNLVLRPCPVVRRTVQFDLQLSLEETADGLDCSLGYNLERIDTAWAEGFVADFISILRTVAADPHRPLDALPITNSAASTRTDSG